jgi:hypothetical protein
MIGTRTAILLLLTLVLGSCGGRAARSGGAGSGNVLGADEFQDTQMTSAYDVINSLRPHWLQGRGPQSLTNQAAGALVVYVDNVRLGTVDVLRQLRPGVVESAQYLGASEATMRFGSNHAGGAVLITTRRQ